MCSETLQVRCGFSKCARGCVFVSQTVTPWPFELVSFAVDNCPEHLRFGSRHAYDNTQTSLDLCSTDDKWIFWNRTEADGMPSVSAWHEMALRKWKFKIHREPFSLVVMTYRFALRVYAVSPYNHSTHSVNTAHSTGTLYEQIFLYKKEQFRIWIGVI